MATDPNLADTLRVLSDTYGRLGVAKALMEQVAPENRKQWLDALADLRLDDSPKHGLGRNPSSTEGMPPLPSRA